MRTEADRKVEALQALVRDQAVEVWCLRSHTGGRTQRHCGEKQNERIILCKAKYNCNL